MSSLPLVGLFSSTPERLGGFASSVRYECPLNQVAMIGV